MKCTFGECKNAVTWMAKIAGDPYTEWPSCADHLVDIISQDDISHVWPFVWFEGKNT